MEKRILDKNLSDGGFFVKKIEFILGISGVKTDLKIKTV
jgi:hypothetical protein